MTKINFFKDSSDAQTLLNQIVLDYRREQKRKRIWKRIQRAILLVLMIAIGYWFFSMKSNALKLGLTPHVGMIDVKGTIFDSQSASADNFLKGLSSAYKNKGLKALIIRIDSPGGSPVQADYIYNAIRYHQKKYPNIKVYAVCMDMCASAAYYVAAAADEIYAAPSSLVGSIGVVYNGFGFVDTLHKLGVTRRLQTAGRNKGFMDQFSSVDPAQEKILQTMLDLIHQQFIKKVKAGRGSRLKIDSAIFSGLFWTGLQAKKKGLIDGFASSGQLAREKIKLEKVIDYTHKSNLLERLAKNMGVAMADQLPTAFGMRQGVQ